MRMPSVTDWKLQESEVVRARDMAAFIHMQWSIFRRASGNCINHCAIFVLIGGGGRQVNMDYALAHSLQHNMDHIQRTVIFYDINCQYMKKLRHRLKGNKFISIPQEMKLMPAIGAWHIHGHRQECLSRYGANFIPGVGRVDGEIMETLWASLNIISPSARGMSAAHRQELLDYQMNDSNFLKMIRMSE